jgi:rhodanese-related sulfurtransferase
MSKQHAEAFLKLVESARKEIRETDVKAVSERLERGEKLLLVDTREDHEWEEGRIPGALHLGKGIIERDIENTIPDKKAEIILYCGGGFRSALAAQALQKMGYTQVLSMDGGFRGWKEAGKPIIPK